MRRLTVDSRAPAAEVMREAAAVVEAGGVLAFPTDTLYGLAVDPFSPAAVERLFGIKGRTADQAIALVAGDAAQVEQWFGTLPDAAGRLAAAFWPGPLTVLVPGRGGLAAGIAAADGTVGVRVPDHAVARALCRACARPLTATSANPSGTPATADPGEVARTLGDRIDLLLDAGVTAGGPPSTLVDATGAGIRLVRAGAIDWDTIQRCVSRK